MPIVHIHLLEGRSVEQKRALAQQVTDAVVNSVGTTADQVKIILSDMKHEDYAVAGKLHMDSK